MSSLVAQIGQPGAVAYVASKVNLYVFELRHVCSAVFQMYHFLNEKEKTNKILKRNILGSFLVYINYAVS